MIEPYLPYIDLAIVCLGTLLMIVAILTYNLLNIKNIPLHIFGIIDIIFGVLIMVNTILPVVNVPDFLGFKGEVICILAQAVFTSIYAIAVNCYQEIRLDKDARPTVLSMAILSTVGFALYLVNDLFNIINYGFIIMYCAYFLMLICAIMLMKERRIIKKYCKKNHIEYKVLTSRKKADIEYNTYRIDSVIEQSYHQDTFMTKAEYMKYKEEYGVASPEQLSKKELKREKKAEKNKNDKENEGTSKNNGEHTPEGVAEETDQKGKSANKDSKHANKREG